MEVLTQPRALWHVAAANVENCAKLADRGEGFEFMMLCMLQFSESWSGCCRDCCNLGWLGGHAAECRLLAALQLQEGLSNACDPRRTWN